VRNIIVHKGGIADAKFEKQAANFPELSAFKSGKPILLNGELVKH